MKPATFHLITGPSHLPNLAVSLLSLRNHWHGTILVYAWPQSYDITVKICEDPRINAIPIYSELPPYQARNAQEIDKIRIAQTITEYDTLVYLDADLLFQKSIQPIFDATAHSPCGLVATQFCDWKMHKGVARNRVNKLRDFPQIDPKLIDLATHHDRPSYNSGIFGFRPDSPALPIWGEWTDLTKGIYISGETTLHPISIMFPVITLWGGIYNCSTMYQPKELSDSDVAIWHFHGDSNTRPQKSQRGYDMWWPEFLSVLDQDIGEIQDWIDEIPNKYLKEVRASNGGV
jgi:hypothetical protein